jgi:hypothetical protein
MPRKKKPSAAGIIAPVAKSDDGSAMLVNKLSVKDARHILQTEGGELDASQIAIQVIQTIIVAGACAYAIWVGQATVWHLALPMVGEYIVLLAVLPIIYLFLRHEAMKKDTIGTLRLWAIFAIIIGVSVAVQSRKTGNPWTTQFQLDVQESWAWITDHHMHWAILFAMAGILLGLPGRIRNLYTYGPPFVPVGLGCGMRLGILFLGFFLLPFIVSGTATTNAWILLGLLVLADVLTLWMHLDIQRRLRKLDGARGGAAAR